MLTRKQTRTINNTRPLLISGRVFVLIAALLFSPAFATAQQTVDGNAMVENAWARAAGQGRASAAYFTVRNMGSEPLRLIDVRTDLASIVTLHKTEVDSKGVARMSAVARVTIEPGAALTLEPGGMHAMMMDLEKPLVEGQTFPLRLKFYDMDELTVEVPILSIAARGPDG
jgi:periplasmic copper chaperone A